ncbi:MAG TPA: NADH-quinone oxidoreductase subunit C [Catalimonadaceae bacterium]|nr:NADH-quinone oxidoreductase subunit C [Catalimonadaceae bacterium]
MEEVLEQLAAVAQSWEAVFKGYHSPSSCYLFEVEPEKCAGLLEQLFRDKNFWCDHLHSVTGEHMPVDTPMIRIHYHLSSITRGFSVQVSTQKMLTAPEEVPSFDSVCHIWKSANWHERETAELLGVYFNNHPDLRHLLLPSNWEGFPLRKDYVPQELYHGVKVKF